jgi:Domain of unknown function (DUF4177)
MLITPRLLVTLALTVSLLASAVSTAQAATTYEYKVIQLKKVSVVNSQQLELLLNQLGGEGWLLVQVTINGVAILQREK